MELIFKDTSFDAECADFVDFASSVDFTALFENLNAIAGAGADCGLTQTEISVGHAGIYAVFESGDIVSKCGVFADALRTCKLVSSHNVLKNCVTGEMNYTIKIVLDYEDMYFRQSTLEVLYARYSVKDGWQSRFRNVNE